MKIAIRITLYLSRYFKDSVNAFEISVFSTKPMRSLIRKKNLLTFCTRLDSTWKLQRLLCAQNVALNLRLLEAARHLYLSLQSQESFGGY